MRRANPRARPFAGTDRAARRFLEEMMLREYRKKRDFAKTPEPAGAPVPQARPGPLAFVVQQHRARRLHYDFRLELDGVLKSWAVPKGPSLDPGERRLAVQVEDHPLEYGAFEGVIPEGEYGGGAVMLWDRGTWIPESADPAAAYRRGAFKFRLEGEKLHGNWALVRISGKARTERAEGRKDHGERRENWLLIKEHDATAMPGSGDAAAQNPLSVATGRSLDEIAAERDRTERGRPARDSTGAATPTATGKRGSRAAAAEQEYREEVAGVPLTHPDRVLYPEQGITKRDLANYYWTIRDWVLPHIADRPLSLVRCPEGRRKACFFQKHVGGGAPEVLGRVAITEKTGTGDYLVVENAAGLVALVQIGVLELHPWGATVKKLETPDRVTFDLDPDPGLAWSQIAEAALELRSALAELGLESFAKTTGGKGLHVVVPLVPRLGWDAVRGFARSLAETVAAGAPERYTTNPVKRARTGRIFIDYLRNSRGATAIGAYSARARPGAPVATPLFWDEVEQAVRPEGFTVATVPQRLAGLERDPWAGIGTIRQSVTAAARRRLGL
ncbi:MAG TPA: non-homologous end-joining DNA ligase [Stellaceae bacterium]|nr:non-homologous end-joining DNA ligase [Stellaceae bacterium]